MNKQNFNKIKSIDAVGGHIVVTVYDKVDGEDKGERLTNQLWTIKEAAERASELNKIAHLLPEHEKKTALDIVEETIKKINEAKTQVQLGKSSIGKAAHKTIED